MSEKCVHLGQEKLCIAPALEFPDDVAKSQMTSLFVISSIYILHICKHDTTSFQLQQQKI